MVLPCSGKTCHCLLALLSKQTSNECLGGQSEFVHSGVSVGLPRAEDRAGKIGLQ